LRKSVLIYGAAAGVLIAVLRVVDYRFLVLEHSIEIYGAIIAALFAAAGIWLGLKLTRQKIVLKEVPVEVRVLVPAGGPFVVNTAKVDELGITARELEVLQLIAEGLSTREMAERLFVSENTIKTHCSRVFDKLGVKRRTQAVQTGKSLGLLS
jgi:DNA-binding CsgD family transcriptional regulator